MDNQDWYKNNVIGKMKNLNLQGEIKHNEIFQILNNNKFSGFNVSSKKNTKGLPYLTRTSVHYSGLRNTYNILFLALKFNQVMDTYF